MLDARLLPTFFLWTECLRYHDDFPPFFIQTPLVTNMDEREVAENMQKMLLTMRRLDEKIAPMLEADGKFFNKR